MFKENSNSIKTPEAWVCTEFLMWCHCRWRHNISEAQGCSGKPAWVQWEASMGAVRNHLSSSWAAAIASPKHDTKSVIHCGNNGDPKVLIQFKLVIQTCFLIFKRICFEKPLVGEEMALWLRALDALAEDPNSVHSTHMVSQNCLVIKVRWVDCKSHLASLIVAVLEFYVLDF